MNTVSWTGALGALGVVLVAAGCSASTGPAAPPAVAPVPAAATAPPPEASMRTKAVEGVLKVT